MPRKRDRYTRARDRHRRPKNPAPHDGFLIADVARLTAVPVRTLRDYVRRGLLRYSEARGTLTRYRRGEVLRLLAAIRLKARTKATWVEIKARLDDFDEPGLQAWLVEQGLKATVAAELGIENPHDPGSTSASSANASSMERAGEHWQRIELLPGLELFLSDGASPVVKSAAERIVQEHVRP